MQPYWLKRLCICCLRRVLFEPRACVVYRQTGGDIPVLLVCLRAEAGMALPKLPPRKLGFVARNKNRFRAQVTLNRARAADREDDLALLRACETRGGIPGLLARLPAGVASIKLPPLASGSGPSRMSLLLRGLNIQYPFSRLILAGLKDTEVRDYALGYRNIAHPDEEMFLIETPPQESSVGRGRLHSPGPASTSGPGRGNSVLFGVREVQDADSME